MINYYYDDKAGEDTLIADISPNAFIAIRDYSKWIAQDPQDYNYKDAEYILFNKSYSGSGVPLNDNEIFLASIEHDGKSLRHNLIKTVLT